MNSQVNLAQNNGESAISIILPKIVVKEEEELKLTKPSIIKMKLLVKFKMQRKKKR